MLRATALVLLAGLCGGAGAQSLGTELVDAETGVLGEPQLIEADVGDDADVSDITLFHRFDGERNYASTPMRPSGKSGVYAASVPTAGVQAERLEFYIIAEETTGDTLLKGNSFEPLIRELVTPAADAAARGVPAPPEPGPSFGRSKYLYYALGVLAVGALVAAASDGGGGGGGSEGCAAEGCRLTVVLPTP